MVPKGWKKRDLHKLITIKHGFAFKSEYFSNDGQYVLLTPGSFNESGGFRNQGPKTKFYSGPIPNGYLLSKGDLLLAMTEQAEGLLGSPLFVPEDNKYLHNQRLGLVEINCPDKICSDFLYLLFNHADSRKQITEQSTGTKVKHTSPDRLCSVIGLIPPLLEQKKIAQILSTWDKAIAVTEKLLANSQKQKKALMQQLLTGKKRLLDENGVRFSGDWGKFTLSHFGKCIRGVSYKPENICENESDNTIRLLRSTNIQNRELNDKDLIILPKKLVKPMQVLMDGDLAICMANGSKSLVGKSAPYKPNDADYTVGAFCALFRPLKSVSSSFVKFLFESNQYQSQLLVILAGSSINNLKGSDIESINIDAPLHYKEQQKIAAVLSAADAEISTLEKKLACLKDEKKALMQQLLTGKRRVSVPVKVEEKEAVSA